MEQRELEYVGFWRRFFAYVTDAITIIVMTVPLTMVVYGDSFFSNTNRILGPFDLMVNWVFPSVAIIAFWISKQATPGKMMMSSYIVDATTGEAPSLGQCIGRYFAYILSALPLGLGFLWTAFDKRKQGWHDKLANTVVVRQKAINQTSVKFN